jgi:hypothetical protein
MDDDELAGRITEVQASHSKKKPTEQYGNITVHTSATAEVREDDDPQEVHRALDDAVKAENERAVAERYEAYLRSEDE